MAKLSPEELEQLEALRARENETDEPEDDFEVVMQDPDGRTVTMPYSKAQHLLKKWGFDLSEIPEAPSPDENPDDLPDEPPEKVRKSGYWKTK